jgi:lysozyme family protein
MSEVAQSTPEGAQMWKPKIKRRPQTMEDIDRSAKEMEETREAIKRYWEKQAEQERMRQQGKIPWWVYLVALLGALVPHDYRERESYSSGV